MHRNPLSALGDKSHKETTGKSGSDRLHEIRIRAGKSGGYIVLHFGKSSESGEPDEHAIVDRKALLEHVDKNAPEPAETDDLDED